MRAGSRAQLIAATILLAIATALGAYAAHGLDRLLDGAGLANFRTGVDYHFYHALGLLGIALLRERAKDDRALAISGWLLVAGIALFCGSLYVGAFVSLGVLGMAAPLGGLCFIVGWLLAAYSLYSQRNGSQPKRGRDG